MKSIIKELDAGALQHLNRCDGAFNIESKLSLSLVDDAVHYTVLAVSPRMKRYAPEAFDPHAYMNNPDQAIFFAFAEEKIAGQIRVRRNWNRFAYVEDFVVDRNYRRRGIGQKLLQRVMQWAKDRDLAGVMLETQNTNVAACRLYARCGFELGGWDRFLYQGDIPDTDEVALFWYLVFNKSSTV